MEALQIEHSRQKQAPAVREALVSDKAGKAADGTYNFLSVVGMLQYLRSHSTPEITYSVYLKIQEDIMNYPLKGAVNISSVL